MVTKSSLVLFLALLLLSPLSFPLLSTTQAESQERETYVIQDGSNACLYLVVERFFACIKSWHDWYLTDELFSKPLLRMAADLDIEEGSVAWEILIDTARRAYAISNKPVPSSPRVLETLGYEGFKRAGSQARREKVASIARIYSSFLQEMAEVGIPRHRIEQYLEAAIKPTVKVVSTQPLSHPDNQALIETFLAFEEILSEK